VCITGVELGINDWHCHHKNPYRLSKDDTFSNLVILHEAVHRLVHLKDNEKIKMLINLLKLTKKQKEKINELRLQCQNEAI
jgi:RNA-directed DNA polymerase